MQRDAALFDDIGDSMGRLKMKSVGIFAGITDGLGPGLKSAMDQIDAFDTGSLGQRIGRSIATGFEVFRSGKIGDVIALGVGIGFAEAINFATGPLLTMDFWSGVGKVALAGFGVLGAGLIKMFSYPILFAQAGADTLMDKIFEGLGKIPGSGMEGYQGFSFQENLARRKKEGTFLTDAGKAAMDASKDLAASGFADIKSAMQTEKLIDTTDMRAELASIFGDAGEQAGKRSAETMASLAPAVGASMAGAIGDISKQPKAQKSDKMELDRWARLGLNIGGGVGLDLNRRVATATEKTARILERVARSLEGGNTGSPVAVWG
jgi:hypothetical protein